MIDSLNSERDSLRKEVASKDKIIELLIKDKGIIRDRVNVDENKVNNNNPFKVPKIYAKNNYDEYINVISVNNRYNALAVENAHTCEKESTEPKTEYRSTTIIGDSIIRDIKQHIDIPSMNDGNIDNVTVGLLNTTICDLDIPSMNDGNIDNVTVGLLNTTICDLDIPSMNDGNIDNVTVGLLNTTICDLDIPSMNDVNIDNVTVGLLNTTICDLDIPSMNDGNIDNVTVGLLNTTICDLDSEVDGVIDKLNDANENSQNYQEDIIDLNDNPVEILTNLRRKNLYWLVIGHININFLYGK